MFLLDANVLSEMQKLTPNKGVVAFLETTSASQLYISSITLAELAYGIHRLDEGKKQRGLLGNLEKLRVAFAGRILPFGEAAALHYGELMAQQEKRGFNDEVFDAMLIAQALVAGMGVVTRNEKHFENRGVSVINPYC